jgi:hypothetical protein
LGYSNLYSNLYGNRTADLITDYKIGELLTLKAIGRQIRSRDQARLKIIFSEDGTQVSLKEETLDICDYRGFIHKVIVKAERQLQELFCDESTPELPPLESLKETFTDRRIGRSFLNSDANQRLE